MGVVESVAAGVKGHLLCRLFFQGVLETRQRRLPKFYPQTIDIGFGSRVVAVRELVDFCASILTPVRRTVTTVSVRYKWSSVRNLTLSPALTP